jgi:exopolysaccharide production protein ExoZ
MRGLAALSVVCGHAVTARPDLVASGAAEGALTILASGVDIFFVISGFIIAKTAASGHNALEFAFSRLVRIFPAYWLVLIVAFISSNWISLSPEAPPLDLRLILAWTYPNWYLPPAWSIAFEMHFYAAVTAILVIAPGRVFELLFAAFGLAVGAIFLGVSLGLYAHPLVLEFGAGVAIAYFVQKNGELPSSPYLIAASVCLFILGWYWIFVHGSTNPQYSRVLTYGLGAGCLVCSVVSAELNGARFPKVLLWLGNISYSLYLVNYLLIQWTASLTGLWEISRAGVIIASILLSIGLAVILHRFVEVPTLNWGRRFRSLEARQAAG